MTADGTPGTDGRRLDFELERADKADGRYLLYYSWPSRERAASRAGGDARDEPPEQRPSSPETDPGRV